MESHSRRATKASKKAHIRHRQIEEKQNTAVQQIRGKHRRERRIKNDKASGRSSAQGNNTSTSGDTTQSKHADRQSQTQPFHKPPRQNRYSIKHQGGHRKHSKSKHPSQTGKGSRLIRQQYSPITTSQEVRSPEEPHRAASDQISKSRGHQRRRSNHSINHHPEASTDKEAPTNCAAMRQTSRIRHHKKHQQQHHIRMPRTIKEQHIAA
uniref:Uncharacterized protein n=1 Tax=Knipowitschia caucasica TaxID=637954 RepID=A0AAV2JB01_KNICA